jgi:hypothetical protein
MEGFSRESARVAWGMSQAGPGAIWVILAASATSCPAGLVLQQNEMFCHIEVAVDQRTKRSDQVSDGLAGYT